MKSICMRNGEHDNCQNVSTREPSIGKCRLF